MAAAIASLKSKLPGAEVITPEAPDYEQSIKRWSDACEERAAAVVKVANEDEVAGVLAVAQEHSIPIAVLGGGHSTSGASSTEGIVIDLRKLQKVSVDPDAKTIAAGGGCTWAQVDVEAAKFELATVGGTVSHTGIGGLTLGGGYGFLSPRYGLTIDNLISVRIVLADGSCVTASEKENPDLFWGIRGAGHTFGVVTEFVYRAFEQGDVFAGPLIFTPDKLAQAVEAANDIFALDIPDIVIVLGFTQRPGMPGPVVIAFSAYNGPEAKGRELLKPLFDVGPVMDMTRTMPYVEVNQLMNEGQDFGGRKQFGGSTFKMPMNPADVSAVFEMYLRFCEAHEKVSETAVIWENFHNGKLREVPDDATAFPNRGDYYNVGSVVKWYDPKQDVECRQFSRQIHAYIFEHGGVPKTKASEAVRHVSRTKAEDLFGDKVHKLRELKKKYDPKDVFHKWDVRRRSV
ncbi:hypothetical protein BDY21DRAFT_366372 [Lineolata rhizophorae]|uniref:FAD-binding PCMH-type domain-containing protein n=1 Tax=Lineolata rhizophorae TaxID=578093 RepID=A0A6A6NRS8_9PEZI|nr:hypothetical protein BDY21DRAFT_366372 [Lineolata rhizophorae]